ncbi:serine/threonine-protein kinase [Gluconobacter wancherniae]|uniref:Protein kinase domain-containing protein n=1 Tax=Gluconobacter wancherniae NBRC 103581 TaxID=656744 RepID=A0A511B2V6_9PROT|nr:serine/threonine-protein kinase [Gluconobacter wancherniae]MBF0854913.1 hypothetical protein [Gluconobacter wancherniae]GBD57920.1 hypothetical protein NBRC103581_02516 [Gluconobacter wancherniae NBRC 103581]GBR65785.1 hypothetical protein AA103581_2010 [Gluconobacter wancherniae NBRC 103581]GEK94789.1 hypothetical protein GWA01_25590 [Gluconobacter wancherniae NBRC 103581]
MQGKEELPELMIGDRYLVSQSRRLADIGGCPTFAAQNVGASGSSCLALAPSSPSPRLPEILMLRHDCLMSVYAHEHSKGALWVICGHPPGPPLTDGFPSWGENQIIEGAVRPLAAILLLMQEAELTCRAIRPDNLFFGSGMNKLVLGPAGLAPPGMHQPLVFEPLSSAVCHPAARGDGTLACDVFSMGVLIVSLCFGEVPLKGLTDEQILERRLQMGSAEAYIGGRSLPDGLASMLWAMLSDDPASRPSPSDLFTMAPSKLFSLRPESPARVPLRIGTVDVWTPRALAWHAARAPVEFSSLLQRQVIASWLRNELKQGRMASLIEQTGGSFLPSSDRKAIDPATLAITRVIAILDPSAPLFWGGRWFWPNALPQMLAYAGSLGDKRQNEERDVSMITSFIMGNPEMFDHPLVPEAQKTQVMELVVLGQRTGVKGPDRIRRLPYDNNPLQVCLSPRCIVDRISQMSGILSWAEQHSSENELPVEGLTRNGLLDAEMRSFLASHFARQRLTSALEAQKAGLPIWNADLILLAAVQRVAEQGAVPAITRRMFPLLKQELRHWRSRTGRAKRRLALEDAVAQGNLTKLLRIAEDPHGLRLDQQTAQRAEQEIARLVHALEPDPDMSARNKRLARNTGEFVSLITGIGVAMTSVWFEFCR